jgi:hypothetical protein
MKLYQKLAHLIQACNNCQAAGNTEWFDRHEAEIHRLAEKYLPRGSGFDSGTQVNRKGSTANKLVLHTSFHHMNEDGFYDGWTYHTVFVRPSLVFGFEISSISGQNRNDIKEYIADALSSALEEEIDDNE